jgi:hypothetical protein
MKNLSIDKILNNINQVVLVFNIYVLTLKLDNSTEIKQFNTV